MVKDESNEGIKKIQEKDEKNCLPLSKRKMEKSILGILITINLNNII